MAVNTHIYRRLRCRWTYAANLTNADVFCPYFGRYGITLPAKSATSTPQLVLLRNVKDSRKRRELAAKLAADSPVLDGVTADDAKISYGSADEVQADLNRLNN